ncbi:MAG: hypothetical protein GKS03_14530 [Alphaproteobacteria bacterium]|nr:hypothetical protein [Alphaproteobacteria bacterium]
MADKPTQSPTEQERRGSPEFRQRAQQAYDVLRKMIADHGGSDIAEDLGDKPMVEDVMRTKPEMIGALLGSVWQLRSKEQLTPYFGSVENVGAIVESSDEPISPCMRTYDNTVQSHLFGAARLFIMRKENEWVKAKIDDPNGLAKDATGGFSNFLRRIVGMKIKVNVAAVRATYPGLGLYDLIKPYLLHVDQFKYVPDYAELSTKSAAVIGEIFEDLRSSSALKAACRLSPDGLTNAKGCAHAYAESEVFAEAMEADQDAVRKRKIDTLRRDKALTEKIKQRTATVFADILNNHFECIAFVERHKAGAEAVVRALAPLYQDDTWIVLAEEGAVENVINCPANVTKELGRDARYVDVLVSKYINQMNYPDIGRDLIKLLQEELSEEDYHRALQDEAAVKVWETVPGLFNNEFKYQHDAKTRDKEIKNFEDLKTEVAPVIQDIKIALGLAAQEETSEV